jgi:hypothetical protein
MDISIKVFFKFLEFDFLNIYLNRSSSDGRNNKGITIGEILRKKPIYKEFILINQQLNGKQSIISSIKSLHTERLKLQFMCEDDKYEQDKFQQWNQYLINNKSIDQQDTDYETDSDIDDHQNDIDMSSSTSKKLNQSELWPLTTINNPPMCTIDEQDMNLSDAEQKSNEKKKKTINIDSDLLIDRYHLTQKMNRENFDALQYSSDDEIQIQSPYSPNNNNWQEEEEEDF